MIVPYLEEKVLIHGTSAGRSAATYDARAESEIVLGPNPGFLWAKVILEDGQYDEPWDVFDKYKELIKSSPPSYALINTIEDFYIPHNVCGRVLDKSTYARVFVSAFNTFFDPGFCGNATIELVNHSADYVTIKAGAPVIQMEFIYLDQKTNRPYKGKYQHQKKGPQPAIFEV